MYKQNLSLAKKHLGLGLAVALVALALIPNAAGLIKAPQILRPLLAVSIGLLAICFALLGTSRLVLMKSSNPPIRMMGLGNLTGFCAIFFLAIFVISNLCWDLRSRPVITGITINPMVVECGAPLALEVEFQDARNDIAQVKWSIGRRVIGHLKKQPVIAPRIPGRYEVSVEISNEIGSVTEGFEFEVKSHLPPATVHEHT